MIIYWIDSDGVSHLNHFRLCDYVNWIPNVESQSRLYSFWLGGE